MKLSICIVSRDVREQLLNRLIEKILKPQIKNPDEVEILVTVNNGIMTRCSDRQKLIEEAKGEYVCFIDDDDIVPDYYVYEILNAIETKPDVVAISAEVTSLTNHIRRRFVLSPEYPQVFSLPSNDYADETYYRYVSPLNPIKRELALKAGYPLKNIRYDDNIYSERLRPVLQNCSTAWIDKPMYYYFIRCAI